MLEGDYPNVKDQRGGKNIKGLPEKRPFILRRLFDDMIEPEPMKRVSIYHVYQRLMSSKIYGDKMELIH